MNKGIIAEEGSHEELMKQDGDILSCIISKARRALIIDNVNFKGQEKLNYPLRSCLKAAKSPSLWNQLSTHAN